MLNGIYLGAYTAVHDFPGLVYQDINGLRDIGGDMLTIDLFDYDFIIATPPCNWWSRANYRRNESEYSLKTKLLLPCIIFKLMLLKKPFIVENVRNKNLFKEYGLYDIPGLIIYEVGRHTYFTNQVLNVSDLCQKPITDYKNGKKRYLSSQNLPRHLRQGGNEVHEVIDIFINQVIQLN